MRGRQPGRSAGIAAAGSTATRRASSRSSASRPRSIPDWLALVGDSADGIPGLPGWGEKSAAAVLARYGTLEAIPDDAATLGRWRSAGANAWRRRSASVARRRCSTGGSPRCAPTCRSPRASRTWSGAARRRRDLEALCREIGAGELLGAGAPLAPGLMHYVVGCTSPRHHVVFPLTDGASGPTLCGYQCVAPAG